MIDIHRYAGSENAAWFGNFGCKITNPKHQISNKSQIPMLNGQNFSGRGIVWIFEFYLLDII
jgi:hypothetical protein